MSSCEKDLIDILAALGTPIIAAAAVFFAALQWYTNNRRLRHELFDRRYPQYEAVQKFLSEIGVSGKMTPEVEGAFFSGTKGMQFTFSPEIAEFIDKDVYKVGVDINLYNELIKDANEIEKGAAKNRGELMKSTRTLSKAVDQKLGRFLRLKQ